MPDGANKAKLTWSNSIILPKGQGVSDGIIMAIRIMSRSSPPTKSSMLYAMPKNRGRTGNPQLGTPSRYGSGMIDIFSYQEVFVSYKRKEPYSGTM
jgi:hypothetical protein